MKIAVYSCSFGDYRGEARCLKRKNKDKIDNASGSDGEDVDYYFFTDDKDLTLNNWNVIHHPLVDEDLEIMDANRWTNKDVKFNLPKILSSYDLCIWMDCSYFCHGDKWIFKPNLKKIKNLFTEHNINLFMMAHQIRGTLQQELEFTINRCVENRHAAKKFLKEVKDINYSQRLLQGGYFIRKNNRETDKLFRHTYNLLKSKKLKRDQNLFSHAIHETNYPTEKILFKKFHVFLRHIQ